MLAIPEYAGGVLPFSASNGEIWLFVFANSRLCASRAKKVTNVFAATRCADLLQTARPPESWSVSRVSAALSAGNGAIAFFRFGLSTWAPVTTAGEVNIITPCPLAYCACICGMPTAWTPGPKQLAFFMSTIDWSARCQPAVAWKVVFPAVFFASQFGSLERSVLPAIVIMSLLFTAVEAPPQMIGILPLPAIVLQRLSSPENVVGTFRLLSSK